MKQSLRLSVVKTLGGMPLCCKLCWLSHRFKVWTLIIDSFIWIAKTMLCRIFHQKQHTQALFLNSDVVRPTLVRKEGPKVELRGIARPFTDYWSALLHWSGARWVGRVVLLTHRKSSKSRDLLPLRKGCLCFVPSNISLNWATGVVGY